MEQKMLQIYEYIIAHPNQNELEIATGVGLKKTPYTRSILLGLWNQGFVVRYWDDQVRPNSYRYFVQDTQPMEGLK